MIFIKAFWHANPLAFIIFTVLSIVDYLLFSYTMYNYSSTMEEFSETDKILSWIPIVNIYVFGKLIVEIKLIKYIEHAQYLLLASRLLFVAGFIFTKPMLMMLAFIVYKVILLGGYRQYFEIMENDNTIVPVMCAITPILGSAIMYTHYRKA